MSDTYDFDFGPLTVYANVIGLIANHHIRQAKVFIDLGCGFGPIAERLRDLGLRYIGIDNENSGLSSLESRGFEVAEADLQSVDATLALMERILDDELLAGTAMLDVIEHLPDPGPLLSRLRAFAEARGHAPLFLSVPNVSHLDLVCKLLVGRWDVSPTGLLDRTHVNLFTESRLVASLEFAGWYEVARDDFELGSSDQHFPEDLTSLVSGTPLHDFVSHLRQRSAPNALVNQFVRVVVPSLPAEQADSGQSLAKPFLTILMRTQGRRLATLSDALLSLVAQDSRDFELLLLPHNVAEDQLPILDGLVQAFEDPDFSARTRIIPVHGGGRSRPLNVGIEQAMGSYVTILDDDDVVFAHWVETFKNLAGAAPGAVLRSRCAMQRAEAVDWPSSGRGYAAIEAPKLPWAADFDLLEHVYENQSPSCSYAIPISCFRDFGIRYDETLAVVEDWDVLLQVASLCGVAGTREVTSLYRRWQSSGAGASVRSSSELHSAEEWRRAYEAVVDRVDRRPLLLPTRSVTSYHRRLQRIEELEQEVHRLKGERDWACHERDDKQSQLEQMVGGLNRLWGETDRLQGEVQRVQNECDRMVGERDELLRQADQLRTSVTECESALAHVSSELEAVYRSRSWQISKPLRVLGSSLRGLSTRGSH